MADADKSIPTLFDDEGLRGEDHFRDVTEGVEEVYQ